MYFYFSKCFLGVISIELFFQQSDISQPKYTLLLCWVFVLLVDLYDAVIFGIFLENKAPVMEIMFNIKF